MTKRERDERFCFALLVVVLTGLAYLVGTVK